MSAVQNNTVVPPIKLKKAYLGIERYQNEQSGIQMKEQ